MAWHKDEGLGQGGPVPPSSSALSSSQPSSGAPWSLGTVLAPCESPFKVSQNSPAFATLLGLSCVAPLHQGPFSLCLTCPNTVYSFKAGREQTSCGCISEALRRVKKPDTKENLWVRFQFPEVLRQVNLSLQVEIRAEVAPWWGRD